MAFRYALGLCWRSTAFRMFLAATVAAASLSVAAFLVFGNRREYLRPPTELSVRGPQLHEFGKCRQGDVLTHEFVLVNNGALPVKIIEVVSSCSCAVAMADKTFANTPIGPGETIKVPVEFTVGGAQSVATARVDVRYRATGETGDPSTPKHLNSMQLSLLVRADVVPDYRISPRELDFGEIDGLKTDRADGIIRVACEAINDMEVKHISESSDLLTASLLREKSNAKVREIAVEVDLSSFKESRTFEGYLTLVTNSKRVPRALVPVRAKYHSPITLDPKSIEIGSDERGLVRKEIRVMTSRPSKIQNVISESNALRFEFDNSRVSQEHSLQLWVKPCQSASLDTSLKVDMNILPQQGKAIFRSVMVPVYRFFWTKESTNGKS